VSEQILMVNFIAADITSNACKTLAQSEPHGKSNLQISGVVINAPDQRYRVVSPSYLALQRS
jgi:hypothetical protein